MSFKGEQKNNPWLSFQFVSATFFPVFFFFSSSFSLFAAGLQVKKFTSVHQPLTHWGLDKVHKDLANFFIVFYLSYTVYLYAQLCLLSPAFPFLPFGIPHSPSLHLLFFSLSCCLELLIYLKVGCSCLEFTTLFLDLTFSFYHRYIFPALFSVRPTLEYTMESRNIKTQSVCIQGTVIHFLSNY